MRSRSAGTARAAILMYHRIAEPLSDVHGLCVSPTQFRAQMAHLRDRYQVVSLSDLATQTEAGDILPRSIAVTFDDGYVDNLRVASDVLSEFKIPATFFLTTDQLQDRYEYWWDVLERVLIEEPHRGTVEVRFPDGPRSFDISTAAARLEAYWSVYKAVGQVSPEDRQAVVSSLKAGEQRTELTDPLRVRMAGAEVRQLASRPGHSIGAHSVRHLMLPVESADVRQREIVESRKALEDLLDASIDAFAYPFGMFSDDTVNAVRHAGFSMALTCEATAIGGGTDLFRLPRWQVSGPALGDFDSWLEAAIGGPASRR